MSENFVSHQRAKDIASRVLDVGRSGAGFLFCASADLLRVVVTARDDDQRSETEQAILKYVRVGLTLSSLLVFVIGGWAATTQFAGAVVAQSTLVVQNHVKKIQHPTGGVVRELRVRNGDQVNAGELLVRLDETQTGASLGIVVKNLDELIVRRARLEAEQDGASQIEFPLLLARSSDLATTKMLAAEQRLFDTRRAAREGQKAQLKQQIEQLSEQVQGVEEQIASKQREIELVDRELEGVRQLWAKNLVALQRLTVLEREAARLTGERGALISSISQTKTKAIETELQIAQVEQDFRSEVGKELADIRAKLGELAEKRIAAEDQLKRVEIRAPHAGRVHQLAVHTVGGVVTPGEALMLIVPQADTLAVEARIPPNEIDQIRPGQSALLRLSAFDHSTTPQINGEVAIVSPDITQDQRTGASYYTVRIALRDSEIARLRGLKLVPGMPVESFIQTGQRTVLTYLTKPLADQVTRAWREQ